MASPESTPPTDHAEAARLEALRRYLDIDGGTRDNGPAFRIGFVQGAHWQREQLAAELKAVRDDLARALDAEHYAAEPTDAEVEAGVEALNRAIGHNAHTAGRDIVRAILTAAKAVRS